MDEKKKRIFISAHYLEIGGAEISLIGLLQAIDYSQYDVDLFLNRHTGELMQFIPKEVNLLPEIKAYADVEKPLLPVLFSSSWKIGITRLWCKLKTWEYCRKHNDVSEKVNIFFSYFEPLSIKYLPSLYKYGEYDLAVNFIGNYGIIRDKIKAKKRISWIHNDYSSNSARKNKIDNKCIGIDYLISISEATTEAYKAVYPDTSGKILTIENILSPHFVRKRSELDRPSEMDKREDETILLSIGRFSYQKNYDNLPFILKRIRDRGIDAKWFIIGFGPDEALIRERIEEAGMDKYITILGKKSNPYPYIKACDWYVQPSRYEGKSVTVREAQMLCKPVIITNYVTAKSQIKDGVDGVIVPMDNEGCADAMAKVIIDKGLHKSITEYLRTHDYGNEHEIEKFYQLIK